MEVLEKCGCSMDPRILECVVAGVDCEETRIEELILGLLGRLKRSVLDILFIRALPLLIITFNREMLQ